MKLYIYSETIKDDNRDVAIEFFKSLEKDGVSIYVNPAMSAILDTMGIGNVTHDVITDHHHFAELMPNYVVTLGGDGTILNAVRVVRDTKVPIIGVNMGRLGFLSSVEMGKMKDIIKGINANTIRQDHRTLLQISSNLPIFEDAPFALNDFTLHKRDTSSMVTIHASVNGKFLNTYWADGIIVSTPTGSTGYSLACGGPIVFPESGNFVITPIAPHNLNVRPLIISDTSEITLEIEGRSENFLCTMDNRYETVTHNHVITIRRCDFNVTLGTLENINFMKTIRQKLMWGLDKRN